MDENVTQEDQAAFDAAFEDAAVKAVTPESKPEPVKEEVKAEKPADAPAEKPEVAALTAEEIAALRTAASEVTTMKGTIRELHGRIGSLNDLLHKTREEKKADGKPAALTTVEMKRIKEAYPELADDLTADISEALANLKTTSQDPEEVARLVNQRVAEASDQLRREALAERHPDWEDIKKSDVFWKWMDGLPSAEADAIKKSTSPSFVAGRLDVFKAWRDKSTNAKKQSQERLESAITPTSGGNASNKSTLSDEEAALKAFNEEFNS